MRAIYVHREEGGGQKRAKNCVRTYSMPPLALAKASKTQIFIKGKWKDPASKAVRTVAIKVPKSLKKCREEEFISEAQSALEFEHSNILKCLGITR